MIESAVPSRHQWLPFALPILFGEEPPAADPWPDLLDSVGRFGAATEEIREVARNDAEGLGSLGGELLTQSEGRGPSRPGDVHDIHAPMRVVLMGRTMAGKSSLLTALTGAHFDRIGDGRQRFSRDTFGATAAVSEQIQVVDTPGVGAHGGSDDTDVALRAALDADVIVWVNSSDSIQEESATALKLLGVIGKPIIVALNCRQSLEGIGRLNLLRFPERVFGDRDGLLEEIGRHMAESGVQPLDVVRVHALAATQALAQPQVDVELHAASRVDDLIDALMREQASHSQYRRALRLVDGQRQRAEDLALLLARGSAMLGAESQRARQMVDDMHARLHRVVTAAGEAMTSDLEIAVGRRRDWHLTVNDFGQSVQSDWQDEVSSMQEELNKSFESRLMTLTAEVQSTVEETEVEWAGVSADGYTLRNLAAFSGVWGNRLARAGVGTAGSALGFSGGAWLGAQIGGALGLATGPGAFLTAGLGLVVGGVAGVAAGRIKNLVDHALLGTDGILRKRREQVATQVGPILDDLTQEYRRVISAQLDQLREALAHERARREEQATYLDTRSSRWEQESNRIRQLVSELDRVATTALLRLAGRERLARSVIRATRVPGVCIFTEFEEAALWEAWLFPPDLGERLAGGKTPTPGAELGNALTYALGLVETSVCLAGSSSTSALILMDAGIPSAITQTWAGGLSAHIGKRIEIETTRGASSI